ncbi:MAG: phosphopentomutase [Acidobacteria bacterium]|nr:phosphopentomutase [Acidobacteriota bacterium]
MSHPLFRRVFVVVLDSVGVGELPDASLYGDEGSDTLGHIAAQIPLRIPHLNALGVSSIRPLSRLTPPAAPLAAFGRLNEASPGKDSVTGHWELMGIVLDHPFPTFPRGFPADTIQEFERRIGRRTLGNTVASGTQIIDDLGEEHMRTGAPIVYTSADSVFQIAAHEDIIPVPELYRICEIAYDICVKGMGLGRVIARPFIGTPGHFSRTANRHDYAMPPTRETLLDMLTARGIPVLAIGKIKDLFAGHGIGDSIRAASDSDVMDAVDRAVRESPPGLVFANLVDFDAKYGHRNDVAGYAANLERFDERLGRLLPSLRKDDLLVLTADHGNDPTTPSTDHSREFVPLLAYGAHVRAGVDLGVRSSFADLGQTLAEIFGVAPLPNGRSFLGEIAADA